jgi:hypothetical protein
MAESMSESGRAYMSKLRGELGARLQMTPEQRRAYISRQGQVETRERSGGKGPSSDPVRMGAETIGDYARYQRRQKRSKSSR